MAVWGYYVTLNSMRIKSLNHIIPIRNIPFEISEERVLRELRIPRIKTLKEMEEQNVAKFIKWAMDTAYTLIEGNGCYATFALQRDAAGEIYIKEAPAIFKAPSIQKLLKKCDYVTLLLATLGPKLEDRVDAIKQEDASGAYYLETVGGWMADYMTDKVDAFVEAEVVKWGYNRTMRYSPGYGDWHLEAQQGILPLLEAEKLNIQLTDSCIMIPRKSVTAAVGWEKRG